MTKMNPEVKAAWVAALRSGEYKQTTGVLKNAEGHCCLGVLCDLYAKVRGLGEWSSSELGGNYGDDEEPNSNVVEWAGLPHQNPIVEFAGAFACLSAFNDGSVDGKSNRRRTFAEIADAIEAQL